ncbi:uncharacterized protein LOC110269381 [Arachis ipaensis]|uniref:uncharacterized protein LOC110269381 n=1 Tax=Arachis ipaensis TaxID=130454 RepID=UPI000A2B14BD|nr:uncharacterized protein LOC110269381 [Arachis ipaensis]
MNPTMQCTCPQFMNYVLFIFPQFHASEYRSHSHSRSCVPVLNHLSLLLFDLSLRLFDLSFRLFDFTVCESKLQSGVLTFTPACVVSPLVHPLVPPSSRLHRRLLAGSIVCSSHGLVSIILWIKYMAQQCTTRTRSGFF